MAECLLLQPNLLTIVPGSINIENFIPGRVYKETLTIYNTCKIPIIVNLRASDKSKLILNKSLLRIEVNDSQKVDLVIQDKINYSSKKLPTTPRKLFIHINGELIEEKYEINLMYFCNNNTFKQKPNNTEKEIPSIYLARYQNQNLNPYNDIKSNRKLLIDKTCNIFIRRYENNIVASLKNKINNLTQQILAMQKNGGKFYINKNDFKNYTKSNNSFFIISNKLDDPNGKFKTDEDVEKNAVIAKNKILLVENSILTSRVKMLEEKLAKIDNFEDNNKNNNYNVDNQSNNNDYYLKNNINNNYMNNENNNYMNNENNNYIDNENNNFVDNENNNENYDENYDENYEENELNEQSDDFQFQEEKKGLDYNNFQNFDNNKY